MECQTFNQAVLAAGYVPRQTLEELVNEINQKMGADMTLESAVESSNRALTPLGMAVEEVRDDFDGGSTRFVVVSHEPMPQFLNKYMVSPTVGVQIKKMLALMFEDHSCSGIRVSDLPISNFPDKDEITAQYIEDQRFVRVGNAVFIGTRLLYEIEDYLKAEFPDTLLHCIGCTQWFLQGKLCSNTECTARLHTRCYEAYFNSKSLPKGICPQCSSFL